MQELTKPKCAKCAKLILDPTFVNAFGGKWHVSCFRCSACGVVLHTYYEKVPHTATHYNSSRSHYTPPLYKKKNNRGYCANCHKAQGATGQAYAADTESPTYSPRFPKQKRVKPPPEPRYGEAEANELAELWGLQKEIAEFEWPKVSSSIPSFPPPQHHITNRLVFFAIEFCPSGQERLFGC